MKKLKEWLNSRTKKTQTLIVGTMIVSIFSCLCISGCGNKSCETCKSQSVKDETGNVWGVSIPGLGGICSSGSGCDCSLWAQSCKVISLSDGNSENENGEMLSETACDVRYYGNSCLGCGTDERSCYSGCLTLKDEKGEESAFFYKYGDDETEKWISCGDTQNGCVENDGIGGLEMYILEALLGVG